MIKRIIGAAAVLAVSCSLFSCTETKSDTESSKKESSLKDCICLEE